MKTSQQHVIFGVGPLGLNLAQQLLDKGQMVRLVSRSGKNPLGSQPNLESLSADLNDLVRTLQVSAGADVIYNCTNATYHQWPELLPPLYHGVMHAAESSGAKLVIADNLYMYGPGTGLMTESSPYRATGEKGKLRAEFADMAMEAHESGKIEVAILRGSDFYGPWVENALVGKKAFEAIMSGKSADVIGNPDMPHTFTFVPDFTRALGLVGMSGQGFGRTWHVPSLPATVNTLLGLAASQVQKPLKIRQVTYPMLHAIGWFSPLMRALRETYYQWDQSFLMDSSDFETTFGLRATPYAEGVAQTWDWLKSLNQRAAAGAKAA